METRSERRRKMKRMRYEWDTQFKFLEECGCGFNLDEADISSALQLLAADYVAHGHNRGQPVVSGILYERPGLQLGEVILDFVEGSMTYVPGGPAFPCGTGWDFVCAGCGQKIHNQEPFIEHPELHVEDGGDNVHVCDDCFQQIAQSQGRGDTH